MELQSRLTNKQFRLGLERATLQTKWYNRQISGVELLKKLAELEEQDGQHVVLPFAISAKLYYEALCDTSR